MADLAHSALRWLSTISLTVGILLIILSWTRIGRFATEAVWNREDSAAYTRLVAENHRLGYEDPASSGLTPEELTAQRKTIDAKLDAMIEKLEYAKSRPEAWSRGFFWSGATLTALGALAHFARRDQAPSDTALSTSLSRSQQAYNSRDR